MDLKEHESISDSFKEAGFTDAEASSLLAQIAKIRADEQSFKAYFDKNWSSAFMMSESFYIAIKQTISQYRKHRETLSEENALEKQNTYTALYQIHTRASQQYLEIITLIKNGFPDGAFARWRSMYELSVIGAFILKYGEAVAEKFIEATDTQDRYDWAMASEVFPETKRHVTFGDILKLCDMDFDVWKDNYTAANQTVHASAQGTFGRLGVPDGEKSTSKRSAYGTAAPAIQSASTLALTASTFISLYPDEKTNQKMDLALNLFSQLTEKYCQIHDSLFPDDE